MSLQPLELTVKNYSPDCIEWSGYKPCAQQQNQRDNDCNECPAYAAGAEILNPQASAYSPDMLKTADRIGIIEMGGLGSILRTTAVTRALRSINSAATINWYTHNAGAELLRYVPGAVPHVLDPENTEQISEMQHLDALINFEVSPEIKRHVARARCVAGFALNRQGHFYGSGHASVLQRLQVDDQFRAENTLNMQQLLLQSVGLNHAKPQYDVAAPPDNQIIADNLLAGIFRNGNPNNIIGLNIGTSEKGTVRRWPARSFARLALELADAYPDYSIAILSGPADADTKSQVANELGKTPDNLDFMPSTLRIGDYIAVIKRLTALVTSNSFAFHVARSQATPVITFEGPLPAAELEVGTLDRVITAKSSCKPCYGKCTNPVFSACIKSIGTDLVRETLDEVLIDISRPRVATKIIAQRAPQSFIKTT